MVAPEDSYCDTHRVVIVVPDYGERLCTYGGGAYIQQSIRVVFFWDGDSSEVLEWVIVASSGNVLLRWTAR